MIVSNRIKNKIPKSKFRKGKDFYTENYKKLPKKNPPKNPEDLNKWKESCVHRLKNPILLKWQYDPNNSDMKCNPYQNSTGFLCINRKAE